MKKENLTTNPLTEEEIEAITKNKRSRFEQNIISLDSLRKIDIALMNNEFSL